MCRKLQEQIFHGAWTCQEKPEWMCKQELEPKYSEYFTPKTLIGSLNSNWLDSYNLYSPPVQIQWGKYVRKVIGVFKTKWRFMVVPTYLSRILWIKYNQTCFVALILNGDLHLESFKVQHGVFGGLIFCPAILIFFGGGGGLLEALEILGVLSFAPTQSYMYLSLEIQSAGFP